jgi:hypothetical protein
VFANEKLFGVLSEIVYLLGCHDGVFGKKFKEIMFVLLLHESSHVFHEGLEQG